MRKTVTHIDGTERPIDPSLLDFLREQTRAAIVERREKLGNGTGGVQEREELAVLYGQALTLSLDPLTLKTLEEMDAGDFAGIPEDELREWMRATKCAESLFRWGCRQAGLDA